MGKQSFEAWLDANHKLPINQFYKDAEGAVIYALYNHDGYIHYRDIAPHADEEKMPYGEFYRQFKKERNPKLLEVPNEA